MSTKSRRYLPGNYAIVPNIHLVGQMVGSTPAIYLALCKHADQQGYCFPAVATLAEEMNCSKAAVTRAIKNLVDLGVLERERRHQDNGRQTTNMYRIMEAENTTEAHFRLGEGVSSGPLEGIGNEVPLTIPINKPIEHTPLRGTSPSDLVNERTTTAELTKAPEDSVLGLYYQVLRFYGLPVRNHDHVKTKVKALEAEVGDLRAKHYLSTLLKRDLRTETFEFKPTLNEALDPYTKRIKIEDYLRRNKPVQAWVAPTPEQEAKAEAERQKQWDR